jgi:anti-anti-sigma factor
MSQGKVGKLELDDRAFALHSERVGGQEHIRLRGEMDLSAIGRVDREMQRAEASDATRIVLDLAELEFIDASSVGLLLRLNDRAEGNGRRLRIRTGRAPQVERLLELTGADQLLPLES